ncbi:MAG: sigma-70 family RNA polymerase sigma factor [Proteobacteria bacterium]|nr:sigma-70 family RNA polymerase sigma factor [Pseudomonadota bacterium]
MSAHRELEPGSGADVLPEPAAGGEPSARLYFSDYRGLHALLLRRIGDPQTAWDILQDAVVTTLTKLRDGQLERPESAGGFIYRVALNHLRNHRRKDRWVRDVPIDVEHLEDTGPLPDADSGHRAQWAEIVAMVLEELPTDRDRDILIRFYLDDEDKESICRALGLSAEHFNRVIFRARERFRELMERKGFARRDFFSVAVLGLLLLLPNQRPAVADAAPRGGLAAMHALASPATDRGDLR